MTIGFLRLMLAIGVLAQHISGAWLGYWLTSKWAGPSLNLMSGHPWPIGNMSVLGFFIISGFLVQEISSRYQVRTLRGYATFLLARTARIYPLYWVMLAAVILALHTSAASYLISQWFGWIMLWPLTFPATLHSRFVFDYTAPLLGPSWTLALDLICYAAGGMVAGRSGRIFSLLLICLALAPLSGTAFYTAIQVNLALFLFGMVLRLYAHQITRYSRYIRTPIFSLFIYTWAVPIGLTLGLQYLLFVASFAITLVWAFTRRSRFDMPLANLTYALYLVQYPIISAMKPLLHAKIEPPLWVLLTLVAVMAATASLYTIESRFERWRRSWLPRARS